MEFGGHLFVFSSALNGVEIRSQVLGHVLKTVGNQSNSEKGLYNYVKITFRYNYAALK